VNPSPNNANDPHINLINEKGRHAHGASPDEDSLLGDFLERRMNTQKILTRKEIQRAAQSASSNAASGVG